MTHSKKIPLTIVLSFVFAIYNNIVRADHGSLGFGIGTASPIITQPGVTLPGNMWVTGIITQFSSFDSASDRKLLDLTATYHIAWFTQGSVRQGLFYAYS